MKIKNIYLPLLIFLNTIQYGVRDHIFHGEKIIGLIDDFIIIIMIFIYLLSRIISRKKILPKTIFNNYFFFLIFIVILSSVINYSDIFVTLQGLRVYLFPIIYYYLGYTYVKNKEKLDRLINAVFFVSIIQIPVCIYQSFKFRNIGNIDFVTGVLGIGFANMIGYLSLIGIIIIYTKYNSKKIKKNIAILLVLLFISIIVLSGARSSIFVFIGITLLFFYKNINIRLLFAMLIIFTISISLFKYIESFQKKSGYLTLSDRNLHELYEVQLNPETGMGRIGYFPLTINKLITNNKLLFGFGPLNWGSKPSSSIYSKVFGDMVYNMYSKAIPSSYIIILGEIGVIGLITYFSIFIRMYNSVKSPKHNEFQQIYVSTIRFLVIILLIGSFMQNLILSEFYSYYLYSILGGYLSLTNSYGVMYESVSSNSNER